MRPRDESEKMEEHKRVANGTPGPQNVCVYALANTAIMRTRREGARLDETPSATLGVDLPEALCLVPLLK